MSSSSPSKQDVRNEKWSPGIWRNYPALQQPQYRSADGLSAVRDKLATLPPLVTSREISELKAALADAQEGRRFLLHAGDCAERFSDCTTAQIVNRIKVLRQMGLLLAHGLRKPIVKIGRFAGQYAKPRSSDWEERSGARLPSYRGDIVNGSTFDHEAREPEPGRLLDAYAHAAMTMNYTRALAADGLSRFDDPLNWPLDWVERSSKATHYLRTISEVIAQAENPAQGRAAFPYAQDADRIYSSHEALLLEFEEPVTRENANRGGWFNASTHMPWIGLRTNDLDGAHVAYSSGIENPIGVKVGAGTTPASVLQLIERLNPRQEAGRLTLITRMGHSKIAASLPPLLQAVRVTGYKVLWVLDPMHGNTEESSTGFKTRRFEAIHSEIEQAFQIHAAEGVPLGGIHLELTGEHVTECVGGASGIREADLSRAYKTAVDPRLNYEQSLELAMLIGQAANASRNTADLAAVPA
ncbi:3-deoxy-7-phosphoheptulonate synthase class II [Paraburkholderia phenazinium]|uniref:Phospho-2-dehydro-3-deoxyheptonate aldolase n=1 Tax=Paraburkholderia phenazinium TaxID=60549 RepID=A0A1G8JG65_9BURK|nr:3-deoxy-7-phosphoheptulonate synthase class II [Paraburkholderia phenazinium]SDI30071.1 3-deoxy-D-arabinoheptulosonate-7-phosphate synthase [Paraburkholderia phenazinium]